VTLANYEAIVK